MTLAAAFRSGSKHQHDLSETPFLVDGFGYLIPFAWCDLSGQRDYVDRNLIETWFQTLTMRTERFHST